MPIMQLSDRPIASRCCCPALPPRTSFGAEGALEALSEIAHDRWHEYDPEDTLRSYALQMCEAGLIKALPPTGSSPRMSTGASLTS